LHGIFELGFCSFGMNSISIITIIIQTATQAQFSLS
jgi:hypothetical protein